MSVERNRLADEDPIAAEAVDWFLRVEQADAPLDVLASWQQWLERSSAHRAAYEAVQRTWQALDDVSPLPWPTDSDVESDRYVGETKVRHWLAAQAANSSSTRDTGATRARPQRISWAAAASVAAIGMLAASSVWLGTSNSPATYEAQLATRVAEHRDVTLPDGSLVSVGARSSVEIEFARDRRSVRLLSGEAFFLVAKDARRPFIVHAGSGRVTALGTSFNVRRYGNAVAVEVAEGNVRLEATAQARTSASGSPAAIELRPGQEAILDVTGALQTVRPLLAENVAAWRTGRHHYIDEPLGIVIADLNRYATQRIVVDTSDLEALRITATFVSDDWRGWLETLAAAVPSLQVRTEPDAVHISSIVSGR